MHLLDHVSLSVPAIDLVRPFYDAAMAALGAGKVYDRPEALGYGVRSNATEDFHSCLAIYASPEARPDAKRHCCFKAATRAQVRAFHAAGLAHGGSDDGAPGLRTHYHANYYGAFYSTHLATASKQSAIVPSNRPTNHLTSF